MTSDELKEAAAVMLAAAEGKSIQWREREGPNKWVDCLVGSSPCWNWTRFSYRVKPEKKVGYVNIHPTGVPTGVVYASRKDADHFADHNTRVACVRIEYEEGQYDD